MPIWGVRNSKPWPGVGIDWSQPLSQGLRVVCALNEGAGSFSDAVSGLSLPLASTASWVSSPYGWAVQSTANCNAATTLLQAIPAPYSVTAIYKVPAANVVRAVAFWGSDSYSGLWISNTGTTVAIYNTAAGAAASWNPTGHSPGAWAVVTVTLSGTAAGSTATCYFQGNLIGSATTTGTVNAPTKLVLGDNGTTTTHALTSPIVALAIHSHILAAQEAAALAANPWQVFGSARPYFFDRAATAAATLVRRTLSDRAGSRGVA